MGIDVLYRIIPVRHESGQEEDEGTYVQRCDSSVIVLWLTISVDSS